MPEIREPIPTAHRQLPAAVVDRLQEIFNRWWTTTGDKAIRATVKPTFTKWFLRGWAATVKPELEEEPTEAKVRRVWIELEAAFLESANRAYQGASTVGWTTGIYREIPELRELAEAGWGSPASPVRVLRQERNLELTEAEAAELPALLKQLEIADEDQQGYILRFTAVSQAIQRGEAGFQELAALAGSSDAARLLVESAPSLFPGGQAMLDEIDRAERATGSAIRPTDWTQAALMFADMVGRLPTMDEQLILEGGRSATTEPEPGESRLPPAVVATMSRIQDYFSSTGQGLAYTRAEFDAEFQKMLANSGLDPAIIAGLAKSGADRAWLEYQLFVRGRFAQAEADREFLGREEEVAVELATHAIVDPASWLHARSLDALVEAQDAELAGVIKATKLVMGLAARALAEIPGLKASDLAREPGQSFSDWVAEIQEWAKSAAPFLSRTGPPVTPEELAEAIVGPARQDEAALQTNWEFLKANAPLSVVNEGLKRLSMFLNDLAPRPGESIAQVKERHARWAEEAARLLSEDGKPVDAGVLADMASAQFADELGKLAQQNEDFAYIQTLGPFLGAQKALGYLGLPDGFFNPLPGEGLRAYENRMADFAEKAAPRINKGLNWDDPNYHGPQAIFEAISKAGSESIRNREAATKDAKARAAKVEAIQQGLDAAEWADRQVRARARPAQPDYMEAIRRRIDLAVQDLPLESRDVARRMALLELPETLWAIWQADMPKQAKAEDFLADAWGALQKRTILTASPAPPIMDAEGMIVGSGGAPIPVAQPPVLPGRPGETTPDLEALWDFGHRAAAAANLETFTGWLTKLDLGQLPNSPFRRVPTQAKGEKPMRGFATLEVPLR